MRCSLIILFLLFCSCQNDDNNQRLTFEELCGSSLSNPIGDQCRGDFLLHISKREGELMFSQTMGYTIQFSIENTYDCSIQGVICSGDYEQYIDAVVSVTADVHEFETRIQPSVAGQKVVALTNVQIE